MKKHGIFALLFTLSILIAALSSCNKKSETIEPIKPGEKTGIILSSNTSVRIDPFIYTAKITLLQKGDTVTILDRSASKSWIGKSKDYWYKVKLKNSIRGWIFGKNIKFLDSRDKDTVDTFISEFWEKETEEMKKYISGKWWSVNRFGDFTSHCLEIYDDGKYKSYWKGNPSNPIEGDYNFDMNQNELVFLKGTSFKHNLNFVRRGQTYILRKELKDKEIRFKKIVEDIEQERKEKAAKEAKEKMEKKQNDAKKTQGTKTEKNENTAQ
ncbi:MAG: SH3 domain-containing protein [bacterium]|nr:SH3 domain-containing protein [bacterium]